MCGRTRSSLSSAAVARAAGAPEKSWKEREAYAPRANLHPGQAAAVLVLEGGARRLHTMRWGLVPSFHPGDKPFDFFRMFNARSETVGSKGVFKRLLRQPRRRCVAIFDGFYEWTADEESADKKKQPWYVSDGGAPLMLAGLWDTHRRPATEGEAAEMESFTLLTTSVSSELSWLHDRMPVILRGDGVDRWLAEPAETEEACAALLGLCRPAGGLRWHPVSKKMNSMAYEEADCATEVPLRKATPKITSFFAASPGTAKGGRKRAAEGPPPRSPPKKPKKPKEESPGGAAAVDRLVEMGFERGAAASALRDSGGDEALAVSMLLSGSQP